MAAIWSLLQVNYTRMHDILYVGQFILIITRYVPIIQNICLGFPPTDQEQFWMSVATSSCKLLNLWTSVIFSCWNVLMFDVYLHPNMPNSSSKYKFSQGCDCIYAWTTKELAWLPLVGYQYYDEVVGLFQLVYSLSNGGSFMNKPSHCHLISKFPFSS